MNDKLTPLSNKVIFITGAAKGLGRSLALKCADAGANPSGVQLLTSTGGNFDGGQFSVSYL